MGVKIEYKASVERDLRKLDPATAIRVLRTIETALASEGHKGTVLSGEFSGLYKLRVGDYRVIHATLENGFLVLRIGHRREVYRRGRPQF